MHRSRTRWLLLAVCASAALAACGGSKKEAVATQAAARVNGDEITVHQINHLMQRQNVPAGQAEAAGKQLLERLIDQELAVQQAVERKLDRDPQVLMSLEAARREVLARAYIEREVQNVAKPTDEQIKVFFESRPELFGGRRSFNLQEFVVEGGADLVPSLREKLAAAKNPDEFQQSLRAANLKFRMAEAIRLSEQIPEPTLKALAPLKDGQGLVSAGPAGVQVVLLAGSKPQPVTLEQARPAIEQILMNEARRKAAGDQMKALREKAKIEYLGNFAGGPAAAASAAASAVPVAAAPVAPAAPASGLSASDISKGLGLK